MWGSGLHKLNYIVQTHITTILVNISTDLSDAHTSPFYEVLNDPFILSDSQLVRSH